MQPRIAAIALLVLLIHVAPSRGQPPTKNSGPDVINRWADLMSLRRAKPLLPENLDPDMMKRILDQTRLQGEWLPKYLLTTNGIEPYPLKGRTLDFTDNGFTQTEGRRRVQTGTFSLDPSSRGLDLVVEQHDAWDVGATPQKPTVPQTLRCGYRVNGDLLTVCYTADKTRPSDLTPGAGRTVVVYERVK
jgi:uncharacterized protein (TIGR03067 family)